MMVNQKSVTYFTLVVSQNSDNFTGESNTVLIPSIVYPETILCESLCVCGRVEAGRGDMRLTLRDFNLWIRSGYIEYI